MPFLGDRKKHARKWTEEASPLYRVVTLLKAHSVVPPQALAGRLVQDDPSTNDPLEPERLASEVQAFEVRVFELEA